MRPAASEVLHFSEDPTIQIFRPPERVGDLFELHDEAGIQLRVLNRLHDFWSQVVVSTLEWSGIRLRNARP